MFDFFGGGVGEWRVRALGPFSAAWGSSCEPVFLLEEGEKAGRWKFAIKVSNRAGLIFKKQLDCANALFWSFPALSSEIIIKKKLLLKTKGPEIKEILDFERQLRLCFSGSSLLLIIGGMTGVWPPFVDFSLMLCFY